MAVINASNKVIFRFMQIDVSFFFCKDVFSYCGQDDQIVLAKDPPADDVAFDAEGLENGGLRILHCLNAFGIFADNAGEHDIEPRKHEH